MKHMSKSLGVVMRRLYSLPQSREDEMYHVGATGRSPDAFLNWGNSRSYAGISSPVTPARRRPTHSQQDKVSNHLSLYGTCDTLSPSLTVSMTSQTSDQPPPTHNPLLTSWEPERSDHNARVIARLSPSPTKPQGVCSSHPVHWDSKSRISDLHPDLEAVCFCDSHLSKKGKNFLNEYATRCLLSQNLRP